MERLRRRKKKVGRPKNNSLGVLTDEDEKELFEILELMTRERLTQNASGRNANWYGLRLRLVTLFYSKKAEEVAKACLVSESVLSSWHRNSSRPSKQQLDRLSFLFEIDKEFFTSQQATIKITEQLTLIYEKQENAQEDAGEKGSSSS